MPVYTCEKCARKFDQKSHYDAHCRKKRPCTESTAIDTIIEKKVSDVMKNIKIEGGGVLMMSNTSSSTMSEIIGSKEKRSAFYEKLHNLLWNEAGFDPAKALEHLTFFFAYRMIEAQADTLGLPNVCRWSYIVNLPDEHAVDSAVKEGIVRFLADPRTKPFFKRHEIKKADVVYRIMKEINAFMPDIGTLHETDTLGDIFEYMLGRGMSTMSDEGQYFTDRKICRLGFKLCYDIKNTIYRSDGSLCTFADWFCGTGGFVTEYVRSVSEIAKKAGTPIDWSVGKNSVYAVDKSESAAKTTLLNQLISTGHMFNASQICEHNSFQDPLVLGPSAPFKDIQMDYLLLNPPYGGDKTKGKDFKFKYTKETVVGGKKTKIFNVNSEIQSIGIEDDDKVSAGVQLAMATLATDGGVCAIVLPQGFFFGATNKCVELRKKIAEEYKIHCVVDIASGAFANTTTKTSMMVFQRGVGSTETVKFIDMDEKVLVEATLADLRAKKYSFNFKQYLPQDAAEIEGFEMVKLGDIIEKVKSGKTNSTEISNSGEYDFYGCTAKVPTGKHNTFDFEGDEYLLFAKSGGNAKTKVGENLGIGKFHYVRGKSAGNIAVYQYKIKDTTKVSYRYLYHILRSRLTEIQMLADYTTGNGNINIDNMYTLISLPIPSLERQAEIVRAIDTWADFAHREEELLKILEQQVMFEVRELGKGAPRVKLGSIGTFTFGYGIKSEDFGDVGLPIVKTKNFKEGSVSIQSGNPRTEKIYDERYRIKYGDLLMVVDGACGESAVWREKEEAWLNQHVAKITIENETLRMYVAFIMKTTSFKEYIQQNVVITTIPHMQRDVAKNFELPLPSSDELATLQSDFDEIRHKHAKIAEYKTKAQAAIQRLIPGAASDCSAKSRSPVAPLTNSVTLTADVAPTLVETSVAEPAILTLVPPSSPITKTTDLGKKTKAELQAIAREAKIKGFSTKSKEELIALIKSTIPRE